MIPEQITLISFGYSEKKLPELIAKDVESQFAIPVVVKDGFLDISEFYDASRRQYDGNRLLQRIDTGYSLDNSKTLGLFNVDLFIPILTYIFGQAYLNGKAGVASVYRLHNERYGMKADDILLIERLKKIVVHELGHTFGLIHCLNPECVMRSSTYVEDIDQKSFKICHTCRNKLTAV
ncbi:MAG TPA: archaemetzincin family Zn-dependent metalloprotease [Lentimicrobium sp.]|nr:archaemetzincin family Zn-dependent metalloprotease [Lentimicrobium sp.]